LLNKFSIDMITSFLNKAKENLKAAEVLLESGCYNASSNRAYFSAFHSALAVLLNYGIKIEINHGKVQAFFSSELIHRRKIFPAKLKSYLQDMRIIREIADYSETDISKSKCNLQINMAKEFINIISERI